MNPREDWTLDNEGGSRAAEGRPYDEARRKEADKAKFDARKIVDKIIRPKKK